MIRTIAAFIDTSSLPQTTAGKGNLTTVFNIILGIMGAVAFFMIILAAFRYVVSQGNADKVAGAKRTIIYSIIGLVIIALAATIVNFVVDQI